MEKYLGKWSIGDEYSESGKIGEITVDDTRITLKIEDMLILSRNCIVSKIDMKYFKAYCNSIINGNGYAYRLIKYNNFDDGIEIKGTEINNITEVSFHIPNLIEWLNMLCIDNKVVQASYIEVEPIIIENSECHISIEYSPSLPETTPFIGFPVKIVLKNIPNIMIRYSVPVSIDRVDKDISYITRFFALLIGRIDKVTDIHFKTQNSKGWFWYYNITDYTHLSKGNAYIDYRRTSYESIKNSLSTYFSKWIQFCNEYELLMEYFFNMHGQKSMSIEDQFITYCRLLDGYYTRKSNEEYKSANLKDKIIDILRQSEIEESLKKVFKNVDSKYDRKKLAEWVQAGFINRITFGEKLRRICSGNFNFIIANSERIFKKSEMTENEIYKMFNATRNYYSHLKEKKDDCLSFVQIYYSIDSLFSIVVSILLHEIGFTHEEVKEILEHDNVVWQYHMGE